jgi:hypothetical protein
MITPSTDNIKHSERYRAALTYKEKGWSIIPVGDDKKPLVAWKVYQERCASVDELLEWWMTWPGANIGIVTGKISNLTIIDFDTPEAVAKMEEHLPDSFLCPIAKTPRGGRHYYFHYEPGLKTCARILPGVDIRSDGGYVVAPPSLTPAGAYEWICLGE